MKTELFTKLVFKIFKSIQSMDLELLKIILKDNSNANLNRFLFFRNKEVNFHFQRTCLV